MSYNEIVRIFPDRLVIISIDIDSAIAGLTAALAVRSAFRIQHKIPHDNGSAPIVNRSQAHLLHVVQKPDSQILPIIPRSDRRFREYYFFFGGSSVYIEEFFLIPSVVVIGSPSKEVRSFWIGIDFKRIVLLAGNIVVVIIMIEGVDFSLQSGLP